VWRWLAAEPREVVDLAGARALGGASDRSSLADELRRWRGIVARRRLVALARRNAVVALGLAALLEILAQLDVLPQWTVVAIPLLLFVVSVGFFISRGPAPFELARLLDDKLGLNDRLATALAIEARADGERSPLEQRTVADAAALLASGREDWRASPARGGREWWALAAPAAALSVIVAIGAATAGNSSTGPVEALGPAGAGKGGGTPNEHHRAKAEKRRDEEQQAPTGKLHKLKDGKTPPPSAVNATKGGYRKIPQGKKTTGSEGKGANSKGGGKGGPENTPTGKLHKNNGASTGEEKRGEEKQPPGTDGKSESHRTKEKKKQKIGFNLKGQKGGAKGGNGPSHLSGNGNGKKPGGNKGKLGGESGAEESGAKGGTPAGTGKAGGEQGTDQPGQAKPIEAKASQSVRIQPGYAPSRSAKAGAEKHKTGVSQGAGGKARTATVTGATQVGAEFSYVPAAGGAVPGQSAGLQQNYLESLKWVERLPW
jgi:hypothetical protein